MLVESAGAIGVALTAAGWVGQACFFSRFFLQWLASERAGRSVVPRAFWWLSLCGAFLVTVFTVYKREAILLPGFLVGGAIAARNLWLSRPGRRQIADVRWLAGAAVLFLGILLVSQFGSRHFALDQPVVWLTVGILGQLLWVSRFPVQWLLSERAGESHFPLVFWWISLAGNLLLLSYAVHLGVLVYILGFLPGPLVQIRNLMLSRPRKGASPC